MHLDFEPGQPVWVKEPNGNKWNPALIEKPAQEPSSYFVKSPDNSIHRRTEAWIKPRSVPASEMPEETHGTLPSPSAPQLSSTEPIPAVTDTPVKSPTTPVEPRRSARVTKGQFTSKRLGYD